MERAKEVLKEKLAIYNKQDLTSLRLAYDITKTAMLGDIFVYWLELEFIVNGKYRHTKLPLTSEEYQDMENKILYSYSWKNCNEKNWWKEFVLEN